MKTTLVQKAKVFATNAHKGQFRKDGKTPYIEHPKAVVGLLLGVGVRDERMLASAWLHDVVEDCNVSIKEIEQEFGEEIARIVLVLTREGGENREQYMEKIKNSDYSIKMIKLADVVHNCSDLSFVTSEKLIRNKVVECKILYLKMAKSFSYVFYLFLLTSIKPFMEKY